MSLLDAIGVTNKTQSEAYVRSLQSISTKIAQKVAASSSGYQTLTNSLTFGHVSGGFKMQGATMSNDASMSLNTSSDSQTNADIQNQVMQTIKNTATANGFPVPGSTKSKTETDLKNLISSQINVEKIVKNTATQKLNNEVSVGTVIGGVDIRNIDMSNKANMYAIGYLKALDDLGVSTSVTQDITQSSSASSNFIADILKGLGLAMIGPVLAALALFLMGAPVVLNPERLMNWKFWVGCLVLICIFYMIFMYITCGWPETLSAAFPGLCNESFKKAFGQSNFRSSRLSYRLWMT